MSKGGVTIPLFHCIFNGAESITHYLRDYDEGLYEALPNIFAICISNNKGSRRKIVAGFIVKTSYGANDAEFLPALLGAAKSTAEINPLLTKSSSLLPAILRIPGTELPTENEMLQVMQQQFLKFSTGGHA